MSTTREDVLKSALALSESDRLLLAAELVATVSEDCPGWSLDEEGLLVELDSRSSDGSAGIPWELVKAQLQQDRRA